MKARAARIRASIAALPHGVVAAFIVAFCFGGAWSLLTPAFQVPDETEHFAYVQHLAETGKLPGQHPGQAGYSSEQVGAMDLLGTRSIIGHQYVHAPLSVHARERLLAIDDLDRSDGGGPTSASTQPPLYYLVATVPYRLFSWASLPTRLVAIRLLSALFFAFTAALAALLAATLMPRTRLAPVIAGLAIALQPAMGFIAGGVTPDSMMDLIGIALLLAVVRGLRDPTPRNAMIVGAIAGAGTVTKLTFAGLLPGAAVAMLVIAWLASRRSGRQDGLRLLAKTLGAALVLPALYALWTVAQSRGLMPAGSSTPTLPGDLIHGASLREELSYAWQLYLPRLPFMTPIFGGTVTPEHVWLSALAGRYGWLDYSVSPEVVSVYRDVVYAMLILAVAAVAPHVRQRWREIAVLAIFPLGLAAVIARSGYDYRRTTGYVFEQARYLYPVAGLYAVTAAAACRALGRRAAPYLAATAVVLLSVHAVSGLFLTYARYYG